MLDSFFLKTAFIISSLIALETIAATSNGQTVFEIRNVNCYQFKSDQNSEARTDANILTTQTWCYHQPQQKHDPLFIFNFDNSQIKAETSFIVDEEGYISHGSLHAGDVTYHKVKAIEFNPFPVPYTEPKNLKPISKPLISEDQAEKVLNELIKQKPATVMDFMLKEGEVSVFAQASIMPWRGFWWGYKNQPLSKGSNSPLAKYDRFVNARLGGSNAQGWESANHRYAGVWWEGHCNGWAASSILRPEPRYSKIDSLTGTVFSVADQKGILAETDYCSLSTFYGKRYRGRSTDDKWDVHPPLFHKTILYYIGSLRKPVVMDYRSDTAVDNHPVSGYTMDIQKIDETHFDVVATLNFHKYDGKRNFPPGIAPMYTRVYKYTLTQNERGEITGGYWKSNNPDFIWVPMGIKDCDSNNPYMKLEPVQQILDLPPAPGNPIVLFD